MFVKCDKCKFADFFEDKCPASIKDTEVVKGIGIVDCKHFKEASQ